MKQSVSGEEYFKFIKPVVLKVGKYLERNRHNIHVIKSKRDQLDIQTNIDLGAEKIYFDAIRSNFPDHAIISEENQIKNKSDYVWFIDPLDGTREFFHDLPLYNTSVVLEYDHMKILSLVYRPTDKELYYAFSDKSWYHDELCQVSPVNKLENAIVYLRLPSLRSTFSAKTLDISFKVCKKIAAVAYRVRALTDENSEMCWVASGKCEAFIDLFNPRAGWWDIAPGLFIAENAGATITNIHGEKITQKNYSEGFIVANKLLHKQLLDIIQNS